MYGWNTVRSRLVRSAWPFIAMRSGERSAFASNLASRLIFVDITAATGVLREVVKPLTWTLRSSRRIDTAGETCRSSAEIFRLSSAISGTDTTHTGASGAGWGGDASGGDAGAGAGASADGAPDVLAVAAAALVLP